MIFGLHVFEALITPIKKLKPGKIDSRAFFANVERSTKFCFVAL